MSQALQEKRIPATGDIKEFHMAAATGDIPALQHFLDQFSIEYIDATSKVGWTALMHAVIHTNNLQSIEFLLKNGASVDKKSDAGNTAIQLAMTNPNPDNGALLRSWAAERERQQREALEQKKRQEQRSAAESKTEARIQKLKEKHPVNPFIKKPK